MSILQERNNQFYLPYLHKFLIPGSLNNFQNHLQDKLYQKLYLSQNHN